MHGSSLRSFLAALAWGLAVLSLTSVPAAGQLKLPDERGGRVSAPGAGGKHIKFEATVRPADPFSEMNQVDPPAGMKMTVQRGEVFLLTIRGTPEEGWHTYPLTRRAPAQPPAQLGSMKIEGEHFQPLYPIVESEAEWKDYRREFKEPDAVYLEHEKPFTLTQEVYVNPTAPAGQMVDLTIKLRVQVCEKTCVWEDHVVRVPVTIAEGPTIDPTPELTKRLAAKPPAPTVVPLPERFKPDAIAKGGAQSASEGKSPTRQAPAPKGLLGSILAAVIGGLVSLLTPCVFPMIPITVSFFLKQAEVPARKTGEGMQVGLTGEGAVKPHSPLLMATIYSATIVLVLAAGGLALMGVLVQISVHPVTNFALAALFLVFALSLLGMYDITLPSWLQDVTASREGRGGMLGVFFMGLTFSIISFACVGPIYGAFISLEATTSSAAGLLQRSLPVLAFSVAFASPFFFLALFPSFLRTLPRAGSWMNSVKVVMGFLELAAAVKFLRGGELALTQSSNLFTFDLTLGIYVALSLACGLYLLGLYRLPHDHEAPESISVLRLMFSLTFITLGFYLMPGLFKTAEGDAQRPTGQVYGWVESFLLPDTDTTTKPVGAKTNGSKLVWLHNLDEALAQAKREDKLVFIDFTGMLCTNCKLNERNVFTRPEVQAAFSQHVLLKLYTDFVPEGIDQKPDASGALQLRNERFQTSALPLYALVRPTSDGYEILRKDEQGLISDIPGFIEFLKP